MPGSAAPACCSCIPPKTWTTCESSAERLNQLGIETALFEPDRFVDGVPVVLASTGSASRRSSEAPDMPIRMPRPRASSAGRSSSVRSVDWELGSCASSRRSEESSVTTDDGDVDVVRPRPDRGRTVDRTAPRAQIGVQLPITVERHVVATFRWAGADPTPAHGDLVGGYYFRPEGEDLYLVGSGASGAAGRSRRLRSGDPRGRGPPARRGRRSACAAARTFGDPRRLGEPVRRQSRLAAGHRRGGAQRLRRRGHERARIQAGACARQARRRHGRRLVGARSATRGVRPVPVHAGKRASASGYRDARILG